MQRHMPYLLLMRSVRLIIIIVIMIKHQNCYYLFKISVSVYV